MTDSLMFQGDDIDPGVRSCVLCGQLIADMRKAFELGDSTVLVHSSCWKADMASERRPGIGSSVCPQCFRQVEGDGAIREIAGHAYRFHGECARRFDVAVRQLADRMVRERESSQRPALADKPMYAQKADGPVHEGTVKFGYWAKEIDSFLKRHDSDLVTEIDRRHGG